MASNSSLITQLLKSISRGRRERQEMELQKNVFEREISRGSEFCCRWTRNWRCRERNPDEQRDSSWWRNGYLNWNDEAFKKRLRINQAIFQFILGEVRDKLIKEPTLFKLSPDTQLAICLNQLAHGCTYSTVGDLFGVAESTAGVIFNQVCKILVSTFLRPICFSTQKQSRMEAGA